MPGFVPVDHDPFAAPAQTVSPTGPKLVPVDHDPFAPAPVSTASDVAESLAAGVERGVAAVPMVIPDVVNAAVAGPQLLGRGVAEGVDKMIGIEPQPRGELWQPFIGSEEALHMLPEGLKPHDPETAAGMAANVTGQIAGGIAGTKAVQAAPAAVKSAVRTVSPLQTEAMARDKALDTVARVLVKEGNLDPQQLQQVARDAADTGTGATLAEATGSRGLLARQKNIAKGTGNAADQMSRTLTARNEQTVPRAVQALAAPLEQKGRQGLADLNGVLAANGSKRVPVDDIVSGLMDKAAKANPANAEGKVYKAVLDELGFAEQQGNTFEALHRAKQGLDNIYIEGADDALRSRATRITAEVRKSINDRLRAVAPAYGDANRKIQAGMVADDLKTALESTNEGSVAALYNKLWAKPERRAETAQRLEPSDYARVSKAMEALKKIKQGGMGGSDTADRLAAGSEMALETGTPGLEALSDPARSFGLNAVARRVSDAVRQKDLRAMQELLTNPDTAEIARRMATRMRVPLDAESPDFGPTWYHGTDRSFDRFDLNRAGSGVGAVGQRAVFLSASPQEASNYADLMAIKGNGEGANVRPAAVRPGRQLVVDAAHYNPDKFRRAIEKATAEGYDTVLFKGVSEFGDPTDQIAVINPTAVRSPFEPPPAAPPPGRPDIAAAAASAASEVGRRDPDKQLPSPPLSPSPQASGPQSQPSSPLIHRIAQAESGGDPNAKNPNSTATGLLQFTNPTWQSSIAKWGKELGYDLKDKNDPQAQLAVGQKLMDANAKQLRRAIGREPTDGDQYAAWFLGPLPAAKLILSQGSGRDAVTLFPRKVVADNRAVFFDGRRPRTVEEVYQLLDDRVS